MEIKNGAQMSPEEMVALATLLRGPGPDEAMPLPRELVAAAFEALAKTTEVIGKLTDLAGEMNRQAVAAQTKYDAAISELRGKVGR